MSPFYENLLKTVENKVPLLFYFRDFSPIFGHLKIGSSQNHGLKFQKSLEPSRDLILVSNPMFLGMGNHLGPSPEASD